MSVFRPVTNKVQRALFNNKLHRRIGLSVLISAVLLSHYSHAQLSLQRAQQLALQHDPWLQGNQLKEQALVARSTAVATLADPVISVGLANLPVDTLQFNQEAMTQFKVGVSQQFPRGDSLALQQRQLLDMAAQYPHQRLDRQARLRESVGKLWFDVFSAEQQVSLVEHSRPIFVQLADIVEASYSSAQGSTSQQDVMRAQVELARLDDRLAALVAERDSRLAQLTQWLPDQFAADGSVITISAQQARLDWPVFPELSASLSLALQQQDKATLAQYLAIHPAMLAIEQQIKSSNTAVSLAEQQFRPQWSVNAAYAYRDSDPLGQSRADFFSVGLTVDLPLFTHNKQDQELHASRLQAEAIKTDKQLLLRQLLAQLLSSWQMFDSKTQRLEYYQTRILPQMAEQAEAAVNAYTSDTGDFSEVMRAKIAQLNTELDWISLKNDQAKSRLQLEYFLTPVSPLSPTDQQGEQP